MRVFKRFLQKKKYYINGNCDLGVFCEAFTLTISVSPVKVFKCFTKLDRSFCLWPLSGTLNFSLWITEVLALEVQVSVVSTG